MDHHLKSFEDPQDKRPAILLASPGPWCFFAMAHFMTFTHFRTLLFLGLHL